MLNVQYVKEGTIQNSFTSTVVNNYARHILFLQRSVHARYKYYYILYSSYRISIMYRQTPLQVAGLVLLILCNYIACVSAFLSTSNSPLIQQSQFHEHHQHNGFSRIKKKTYEIRGGDLGAFPVPSTAAITTIGGGVTKFYRCFPVIAGFLTCSTKAMVADTLAQYRDVCTTKFNIRRNIAMVLYSGTVLGIGCEIMYNRVFPILFGNEHTLIRAIKMTLFDAFINAPFFYLPPAYITQALLYKYPIRDAIQKYITDVKENGLLRKYWSLWVPMSLMNFLIVPPHFRVAFVALVSFFWMIILSTVANNEQEDPASCPLEPEPAMKNPRALD
ncbi:MAG: hypothetical protein ACI8RD_000936 [Bacillariaceae sp.]|jgi:hypothetical protein